LRSRGSPRIVCTLQPQSHLTRMLSVRSPVADQAIGPKSTDKT